MENATSERVGVETRRTKIAAWVAPGFLVALVAVFVLAPWSFKGKLDAVCYGI